jgi:hypothetical protein
MKKVRALEVEEVSQSTPAKGKPHERLTLEEFELDYEGRVLRCFEGKARSETHVAKKSLEGIV